MKAIKEDENQEFQVDWMLIHKKIEGTLSEAETQELHAWLQQDKDRDLFLKHAEAYSQRTELPVLENTDIDRAWDRFYESRKVHRSLKSRHAWGWIAAAVCMIGIGCGLWFGTLQQDMKSTEATVAFLSPGRVKAALILSDGTIVDLKTQYPNKRIMEQQADIILDSVGISYKQTEKSDVSAWNTIRTPQGGEYKLTLVDGTCIWLNAGTELTYPVAFSGSERRVKLIGEAYFEVAKNEKQPFVVETNKMDVKVLGTAFNVNVYENEPEVVTTLVNGRIQIDNHGGSVKSLSPSEQAILNKKSGEMIIRTVNPSLFTQWRVGRFVFRNDSLESILRTLSRWYDMDYEFIQPELKDECFYGVLSRYSDVKQLLTQFEKTGKVHFIYDGKKVMVKK